MTPPMFLNMEAAAEWLTRQGLPTPLRALAMAEAQGSGPKAVRTSSEVVYLRSALLRWREARP